jgi:hypothetical protein
VIGGSRGNPLRGLRRAVRGLRMVVGVLPARRLTGTGQRASPGTGGIGRKTTLAKARQTNRLIARMTRLPLTGDRSRT